MTADNVFQRDCSSTLTNALEREMLPVPQFRRVNDAFLEGVSSSLTFYIYEGGAEVQGPGVDCRFEQPDFKNDEHLIHAFVTNAVRLMRQFQSLPATWTVRNTTDLRTLNETINKCLVKIGDTVIDRSQGELTIPFLYVHRPSCERTHRWPIRTVRCDLTQAALHVHGVSEYTVDDAQAVQNYRLDAILFDDIRGVVEIATTPSLGIEVKVDGLHVSADVTDTLVATERVVKFLGVHLSESIRMTHERLE